MPGMTMSPNPSMLKGRLASESVMARGNSSLMGASKDLACSQTCASSWMQLKQCTECQGLHLSRQVHHPSVEMQRDSSLTGVSTTWAALRGGCGTACSHRMSLDAGRRWPSARRLSARVVIIPTPACPESGSGRALGKVVHCIGVMAPADLQINDVNCLDHTRVNRHSIAVLTTETMTGVQKTQKMS